MTAPLILAFDTSAAYCAAALLRGDDIMASTAEDMTRGQAERLMPLLIEMLAANGVTWRDLSALGVGIGPGNFTGIRIAVSAARGLALALDCPAVGVSGCAARAFLAPDARVAIPAPRDQVYLCGPTDAAPTLMPREDAPRDLRSDFAPDDLACAIARIAATRWRTVTTPPAPLYVRPADAAPSSDAAPVILD
jgi:tRNA threonylcarbamoyl adenosine modification protein YeaZ